ncbi:MAG TPA: hypothetical protein VFJ02_00555 [Vicinamibacterales bacterium]|nr:hypothetical protein [Vicinamibacterales bacterium]
MLPPRVEAWLSAAVQDAERRGLPDLKPLLEGLAKSLAGLRAADDEQRAASAPSRGDGR